MSTHQHEEWQMMESAKGGRYCGACGDHEPPVQVIPEAAVEAAARMLAETCDPLGDWDKQEEAYRGIYRRRVMPCLKAAAPHMLADAWDEGADFVNEGVQSFAMDNPYRK